ncbi:MAG: carboxypeptidase-like regulatory domain-containing protein, partial [Thermoanaerobaculia bacterium]
MTTENGDPLVGAEVIVTRGPDRLVERTVTDSAGKWRVRFDQGTGDYLVYIAYPDRTTFRQRVTRGLTGFPAIGSRDSVFAVTVKLARTVTELATIQVRASAARPERNFNGPASHPEPGSSRRDIDDFIGQLSPDDAGNIFAQALTTPGLIPTPSGVSAFGLAANQSNVVLGSLQLSSSQLPRDARTFTRVATSTYDPAKGWFSGAQVSIDLSPGS